MTFLRLRPIDRSCLRRQLRLDTWFEVFKIFSPPISSSYPKCLSLLNLILSRSRKTLPVKPCWLHWMTERKHYQCPPYHHHYHYHFITIIFVFTPWSSHHHHHQCCSGSHMVALNDIVGSLGSSSIHISADTAVPPMHYAVLYNYTIVPIVILAAIVYDI